MDDSALRHQQHGFDFNSYSAYGHGGYTHASATALHHSLDLPLYQQVRTLQIQRFAKSYFQSGRRHNQIGDHVTDSWLHRPPNAIYPVLPEGYAYVKDDAFRALGKRDTTRRRDGVHECEWPRTGIHDLYEMSLWTYTDERILIIEESELNDKVEEWTSICVAMEQETTYVVCEPAQMGRRLHRYMIVANFVHRLIYKNCIVACVLSFLFPHKRHWFWPPFLLAALGILVSYDISKDPASEYEVVEDRYVISRFPLYRLRSMDATILRYQPRKRRKMWQKVILGLTFIRVLYLTVFPVPCICDL